MNVFHRAYPLMRIWFAAAAAITLGAVATFVIVFRLGLIPAVTTWEDEISTAAAVRLQGEIERMLRFSRVLDRDDIRDYIAPNVDETEFLVVYDRNGDRLYAEIAGREVKSDTEEEALRAALLRGDDDEPLPSDGASLFDRLHDAGSLRPLESADRLYGYLAAGTAGFRYSAANRHLYRGLIVAVSVAVILTAIAAVVILSALSRHVNRGLTALIAGIRRTASADGTDPMHAGEYTSIDTRVAEVALLDEEIRRLRTAIGEERSVRRNWAMDIAHDLRTPVTALRAQLEAVQDGVLPFNDSRIGVLLDHVEGLESLVQSFLLLTRVEAPDYHPEYDHFDGVQLISRVVARYADRLVAAGHRLEQEVPPEVPLTADPTLIERAVGNLLENAVQHGRPGKITISCTIDEPQNSVRITVQNGGTIDPTIAPVLFDRFARSGSN